MLCVDETKCSTIKWKIENFTIYSSPQKQKIIRSPVWKMETTEGCTWWRFILYPSNLDLHFALINLKRELKEEDYKYEMFLLTSSGGIQLCPVLSSYTCCYRIEKNTIFGEISNSLLPQETLTLRCKIWQSKLRPGRCLLQNALHEVNFTCCIEGFYPDSDSTKRSVHQQGTTLLNIFLWKMNKSQEGTHKVRVEIIPDYSRWSTFINCNISMSDGCGQAVSSAYTYPVVSWEWEVVISPENCTDSNLHLEFETLISVDVEHQHIPIPFDAGPGSSNSLSDDFLQLYKKSTLSDVTLNTEDKPFQAHRNILATRSPVFHAMFEKDQMTEGQSGVVDIEDVDSETMDRLLVYLYSDSLEELQWEEASALYYAADKYAVLHLKQKCAEILMFGLTADNVCDAIILADKHADEQLMLCAVDFVRDHEEILSSSAWASLEESNSPLTTKVLRHVIQKKAKKLYGF